jgi:hypothetical protein
MVQDDGDGNPQLKLEIEVLDRKNSQSPIETVARWIEDRTGIARDTIEDLARRLPTAIGAQPHVRRGAPVHNEAERRSERPVIERWPDLRPLLRDLRRLDRDGTTRELIRELQVQLPDFCRDIGLLPPAELVNPVGEGKSIRAVLEGNAGPSAAPPGGEPPTYKQFRTKSQIAKHYECTVQSLGNWEREGLLKIPKKGGFYVVDDSKLTLLAGARRQKRSARGDKVQRTQPSVQQPN